MANRTKLELTWIGKDQRPRLEPRILLEDSEKSYHAKRRVGKSDEFDNRLIFGDNLLALRALEQEFAGRVKCIYIDPPFNTGQAFEHYDDGLEHSIWLTLMRDRLEILHRLLSDDGTAFIHIDDTELAYLTVICDEIFQRRNRVSLITFKQSSVSGPKAQNPGVASTASYILYYVKDKKCWNPNKVRVPTSRDDRYSKFISNFEDDFGDWNLVTIRSELGRRLNIEPRKLRKTLGANLSLELDKLVLGEPERVVRTARVAPKDVNEEARRALAMSGSKRGIVQRSKREGRDDYYFLNGEQLIFYAKKVHAVDGVRVTTESPSTIWVDLLSNNLHNEGGVSFPNGKKPEALVRRLLALATDQGDLVLDSFAGSGTTGAVAHKMGRRWIMVELGEHCHTHVLPRLGGVIDGTDTSGITAAVNWHGGGGFRYYRLAPSLLTKDRWDNWVISPEYDAAMLAEALCKHEGFTYAPDENCWWKQGHAGEHDFIYVTTQTLTAEQLIAIHDELHKEQSLLICCSAFRADPDAFTNITLKKIPNTVLGRCEFGRDDYSLEVAALPDAEPEPGTVDDLFAEDET